MEDTMRIPTKSGQICRILNPLSDEDPEEVFVVAEDPAPYDDNSDIYIVSVKDLQRNLRQPLLAPQKAVQKSELAVIAESLEQYVSSWNS